MNDLSRQLQELSKPYIVMGVGIPGSGKTTILSETASDLDITRICPDEIREELTGDAADQNVNAEAWAEAYRRVELALSMGRPAIIDATHAEAWRRPQTVEMYRSFGAAAVVACVFQVPLEVAKTRNLGRERKVPEYALELMAGALERDPVSVDEGFDRVITMHS